MAKQPESALVRDIRVTLLAKVGGFWIKSHGNNYAQQGVPDLLGCVEGVFFGLEVKVPGQEHTLTPLQRETMLEIQKEGGFATMVSSWEEALEFVNGSLGF